MKWVLTALCALGMAAATRADDHVVIVFDTSSSMSDTMKKVKSDRMSVAKGAMAHVLKSIPPTTKVGILTFNGWVYDLQPVKTHEVITIIGGISPSGSTPLYEHIAKGADRLLSERAKALNVGSYKLVVVTDGEANPNDETLNRDSKFPDGTVRPGVLKDIISRGIVVDAIGLDMSEDHSLKKYINGTYMRGDDPQSVQKSLSRAVAEVGFKTKDSGDEDAFREISGLPEEFARTAIKGLTEFRNHPIGTQAPVVVINPETGQAETIQPPAVAATSSGMTWVWWVAGVLIVGLVVVFLLMVLSANNDPYRSRW